MIITFVWSKDFHFWLRKGFPGGSVQRIHLQCRRPRFDPWVKKVPWRRAWVPTLVFSPRESYRQRSLAGCRSSGHRESVMTEWLTHLRKDTSEQRSYPSRGNGNVRSCLRSMETRHLSTRSPTPFSRPPPLAAANTQRWLPALMGLLDTDERWPSWGFTAGPPIQPWRDMGSLLVREFCAADPWAWRCGSSVSQPTTAPKSSFIHSPFIPFPHLSQSQSVSGIAPSDSLLTGQLWLGRLFTWPWAGTRLSNTPLP